MARPTAASNASRRRTSRGSLDLQCPECTGSVPVPRRALVEDAQIECPRCDCAAVVTRQFEEGSGRERWILVDPLADYADDGPA